MKRKPLSYIADFYHGATRHPFGGMKPHVVLGRFPKNEIGRYQKLFFDELRSQGFKRTVWQLIFPGQIAGIINFIPVQIDGTNEYHVKFYNDGTID